MVFELWHMLLFGVFIFSGFVLWSSFDHDRYHAFNRNTRPPLCIKCLLGDRDL